MTSGQFTSFPTDQIWVDRASRQRQELRGIDELARSIADNGLINPPVIRRSGELVAGERRYTACKQLGWTAIPVQFVEDLSELELQSIELEENIRRSDLTWQEQCQALDRLHEIRKKADPNWTASQTAAAIGMSPKTVSSWLQVASEIKAGNERLIAAPKMSTAKNITARAVARRTQAAIAEITEAPKKDVPLLNTDFTDWQRDYSGPKFNFIHCDFPYGVGMHKSDQGAGANYGEYTDTEGVYWELLGTLDKAMDNVVHEFAHLMFWFSMDHYHATFFRLQAMGWRVNPFPLIWMKSDNTGILPDANRGPRRIYETAFFASRGDRFVNQAVSNAFACAQEKSIHMNQKPTAMLRHFFRMFIDGTTSLLDPTCGSGSAVKTGRALGAATVLGLEKDGEFYERAVADFDE